MRFINGHNARLQERQPVLPKPPAPNPRGLCMCGCGQPTKLAAYTHIRDGMVYGEHLRYLHGHNRRRYVWQRTSGKRAGCWYVYTRDGQQVPWARIVMQNELGRPLSPSEDVHHRNCDPSDDRPDNLEVLSKADHARRHHAIRRTFIPAQ